MIRLYYYNNNNLGDELSRYIVEKLSGENVKYCNPFSWKRFFHNYLSAIKQLIFNHQERIPKLLAFSSKKVLICVGSLIESSSSRCIVWGTGWAQNNIFPTGGHFLITRGYESKKLLEKIGFKVHSNMAGDPALLMPLLYSPNCEKSKGKIAIIPHVSEFDNIVSSFSNESEFTIINFRTIDIEETINILLTCDFVYSSSLHGIILSHAYGISCVRFKCKEIGGGDFKFRDYFSSVGIDYYDPLSIEDIRNKIIPQGIITLPSKYKICEIQKELLRLAPFKIKSQYLKYC